MKLHPTPFQLLRRAAAALLCLASLQVAAHAEHSYEAWRAVYNNDQQAGQVGKATVVDARGNVYVTGTAGVLFNDNAYYTAKYDALDGHLIWQASYDPGLGDNTANDIAIDAAGDIIVTGGAVVTNPNTQVTSEDYVTIKYSGFDGTVLWVATYSGAQGGADEGLKVVTDASKNVIVTGRSYGSNTQYDFVTIKYNSAGVQQWAVPYSGGGHRADIPSGLAVDSAGDIIVTGSSYLTTAQTSYYTVKYKPTGAISWAKTYTSASDAQPTAVAIDPSDNVIVTGFGEVANGSRFFYTIAYGATSGNTLWTQTHDSLTNDFVGGGADVAVDHAGNVIVTGTTVGTDPFDDNSYYTAKYAAATDFFPGFQIWEAISNSSSRDGLDHAQRVVVDGANNVVVTGYSDNPENHDADYYTVKYDGATGNVLWEQIYDGAGGDDKPAAVAVDKGGNVVITGVAKLEFQNTNILYDRIVSIKYNRLALTTGEAAPVTTNVPAGSKVLYIGTPAIGDNGNLAAKVYLQAGTKHLFGILTQGSAGGSLLPAVQGNPAAGLTAGNYYSFSDPIVSSSGLLAFSGRISGVPLANSFGVWTSNSSGALTLVLQSGKPVVGLGGPILRSVVTMSMRGTVLLALINVTGPNPTELFAYDGFFGGRAMLRVGDPFNANGKSSTITKISALLPALGSAGQGRTQANANAVAKVSLKDGRTAVVIVDTFGNVSGIAVSGTAYDVIGDSWLAFGLPDVDSSGNNFTMAAMYKPEGAAANIGLFAGTSPVNSFLFAARGGTVPFGGGAKYLSFLDPVRNSLGDVAYFANLYGPGVTAKNHIALMFGTTALQEPLARLGSNSTDTGGAAIAPVYSGFLTLALPGGVGSGPIFESHLAGPGVTAKNNLGLWAVDDRSLLRRLLRTGDTFTIDQIVNGNHVIKTVSSMVLLQPVAGAYGARRSFNETGGVAVLVGFTDKTQAILRIGIP